jgi:hypothetical protein
MTSINALKFDDKSGILICDEQRTWNDEELKINSCDKIRPVVSPSVLKGAGITASYGNTGTSTLGDEWTVNMQKLIDQQYQQWVVSKKPPFFMSVEDIAKLAFREQTRLKFDKIDQQLKGKFGFTSREFIAGSFLKDGNKIEIKDKKIIEQIPEYLTWASRSKDITGVFLNAGVIAGYSDADGFRIFLLSLIDPTCEPVSEIFLAEGSGLDVCDHLYTDFANARSIPERRGAVDRGLGTLKMLEGLNYAINLCAGVGGYIKIIYVNGHEKDYAKRVTEISDHRSKLAGEIAEAYTRRFISEQKAIQLAEQILYLGRPFKEVNEELMKSVPDRGAFLKHLRGY